MRPALAAALACLLASAAAAQPKDRPDFLEKAARESGQKRKKDKRAEPPPVTGHAVASGGELPKQSKATGADAAACSAKGHPNDYGSWCEGVSDCLRYCRCACDFDISKWDKDSRDDGVASCKHFPKASKRVIPPDSQTLLPLPTTYAFVDVDAGDHIRATQDVIDALWRLDNQLATSETREKYDYRFRVNSCYRSAHSDSQPECGYIYKGQYEVDRSTWDGAVKTWTWLSNPNNLGLAWPGASPHSAGVACDLILMDKKGHDCFDWRAGAVAKKGQSTVPTCSIPARQAARYAVDELTSGKVGARRLNYEAWHFEWDPDPPGSRCGSRAECDKHWPLLGHP